MTNEESKKYLECVISNVSLEYVMKPTKVEVLKNAVCALEKRIPKKIDVYFDGYSEGNPVWEEHCPACGFDFDGDRTRFCPSCGQAIDWSDDE